MNNTQEEAHLKHQQESAERLAIKGRLPDANPVLRAYAKGIRVQTATDAEIYLGMTLEEIAMEWNLVDPVDLLAVIDDADATVGKFPRNNLG